jgi:hypothetical protein
VTISTFSGFTAFKARDWAFKACLRRGAILQELVLSFDTESSAAAIASASAATNDDRFFFVNGQL